MNNVELEVQNRVDFIKSVLKESGSKGIIYGNSGGKDSALVGILCKMACDNTLGVIMPCSSKQNYNSDMEDGLEIANKFSIKTKIVDLTNAKESIVDETEKIATLNTQALSNIAPRLRMTTLYTIAANEGRIVAGTGNKNERFMGYFTKWGDGACDFNPIADMSVSEIYAMLEYLKAPESIIKKAPSAGLFDGQTDEKEMGVTYKTIDDYMNGKEVDEKSKGIIERYHSRSEHKRRMPKTYK